MTTTAQLHSFGHYTNSNRVEDMVGGYLDEFAADYDFDGLVNAFRVAINDALDGTTIVLAGNDFYAAYPPPEDSEELIAAALESVDLGKLAEQYEISPDPAGE